MNETAHSEIKTILEMDLVSYSDVARLLEENLSVSAVKEFQDQIQQFVDYGLRSMGLRRDDIVIRTAGDNAILIFDDAETMHRFAQAVQTQLLTHNATKSVKSAKRWFRMGAATGIVLVIPSDHQIVGSTISRAVRLEAAAKIGQLVVDLPTFDTLPNVLKQLYSDCEIIRGKRTERFQARRCTLIDVPKSEPVQSLGHILQNNRKRSKAKAVILPTTWQPVTGFDDRPAIAVMPFNNPRGDPDQQYFADGITDDIITELARWRIFPVIARGSTFALRDQALDAQSLGKQLGASYVLEGSVSKIMQRVRVRAQLIDAITGHYVLAERYERDLGEVFGIQDEIVETIVGSITPEVLKVEWERVGRQRPSGPTSYHYFIRGLELHYRYTKEDNAEAQGLFRQAIEADSKNAQAHAVLALAMVHAVQQGWRENSEHNYETAYQISARAVALDPRAPFAHFAFGLTSMFLGHTEHALAEMRDAVRSNPSHAAAYAIMAHLLCYVGRPGEGLEAADRAVRLSPYDPRLGLWVPALSQAYYFLGKYEDAVTTARRALSLIPTNAVPARFLAASLGQLGRISEATPVLALLRNSKEPTLAHVKEIIEKVYRVPKMTADLLDGLKKAGMI